MIRKSRTYLATALIAMAAALGFQAARAAHAESITPAITAVADDATFGGVLVVGYGFDADDPVNIEVINPTTGAMIDTVATGADGRGSLSQYFAFTVPCGLRQVRLQAVDTVTNETTAVISLDLGTTLSMARDHLQAAQIDLASLVANPPQTVSISAWLAFYEQLAAIQGDIAADQAQVDTAQSAPASCG